VGHAVVSLARDGVKAVALLGGGIRHDRREGQPKPQRKRPQGVRTGEWAREAARVYRALDGWRDWWLASATDQPLAMRRHDLLRPGEGAQQTACNNRFKSRCS